MRICVLGLGYIGLPTAAMLASAGYDVAGYDVNRPLLNSLESGVIGAEPEVRELAKAMMDAGKLKVANRVGAADAFIICVPSPMRPDRRPDLSYVHAATAAVLEVVKPNDIIVLESTVPPGTVERTIVAALRGRDLEKTVLVAHCPERVLPGNIISELRNNARVIGGVTEDAARAAKEIYSSFVIGELFITNCKTAEMVKVMENVYRDVNIALANEFAVISEDLGVDAWEAIRIANHHPRVSILSPGPGTGGHCIPIDPYFLIESAPFTTDLIQAARRVNSRMPDFLLRRIQSIVPCPPYGRKICILGATYKADVDDCRESPSQVLVELLQENHYEVSVYDPIASRFAYPLSDGIADAVRDADAVVLMVDHAAFKSILPQELALKMKGDVLVDTRNVFNRMSAAKAGLRTYTVGVPFAEGDDTVAIRA